MQCTRCNVPDVHVIPQLSLVSDTNQAESLVKSQSGSKYKQSAVLGFLNLCMLC